MAGTPTGLTESEARARLALATDELEAQELALAYRGIEHRLVIGRGGHSLAHGGAIFPDTLRWLWRKPLASPPGGAVTGDPS